MGESFSVPDSGVYVGSAFRVTDWSGTPQHGNPCEEYSGKPDPACI